MLLCINIFECLDLLILSGSLLTSHLLVGHMFTLRLQIVPLRLAF